MKFQRPGTLSGAQIILEPIAESHREGLRQAAAEDLSIWTYFPINFNGTGADFDAWFDYTLERTERSEHYPFVVKRAGNDRVIGTTRFYDMHVEHKRLAIGSTWYAPDARGTRVNPEVRLLTLRHAFETFKVNRVELIADPFNLSSRSAMKILGAVQEGILRRHMVYKDGRIRDSVIYSLIAEDWAEIKQRLLKILEHGDF